MSSAWSCSNCTLENESSAERCAACETARPKQKKQKKEEEEEEEDEEMEDDEEEYAGSDEDEDNLKGSTLIPVDDEEIPDMDDFDKNVGGALAVAGKAKVMEQVIGARKTLGDKAVALIDQEPDYIVRTAMKVDFLDATIAKVWGMDISKPMVIELKFTGPRYLEDRKNPPTFNLYQSSDKDLEQWKLKDISSFGLEWQLKARLNDWLNGQNNWPPKDNRFVILVMNHLVERINSCTKTCIICDGELPHQMIKPAVCAKNLCVHSHEQYGLGADVASEIRDNPDVVDLLISFCFGASQAEERRFNPYPIGVEVKYVDENKREMTAHMMQEADHTKRNLPAVSKVLSTLPAVSEMQAYLDTKSLKTYLDNFDRLAFPLLRWIITSNRAYLVKIDKKDMIEDMITEHQYVFLSSPPEKEAKFQKLKQQKGSFWAFHGSGFGNWHSILRIGLKNYSNTEFMSTGAAYGAGIYLSPNSATSLGYARSQQGWSKSSFSKKGNNYMQCLCICEVIDNNYKPNPHYVIPDEDHVMTRYFFIYNGSSGTPNIDASKVKNLKGALIKSQ